MVAETVRAHRKAAGLTQKELAEKLQTGQSTVAQWENGVRTPPIKRLFDIAEVLGVAPAVLLGNQAQDRKSKGAEDSGN